MPKTANTEYQQPSQLLRRSGSLASVFSAEAQVPATANTEFQQPDRPRQPLTWPNVGFVGLEHIREALDDCSDGHVRNLIRQGVFPAAVPVGHRKIGWPVETARRAIEELPNRILALRAVRKQQQRNRSTPSA